MMSRFILILLALIVSAINAYASEEGFISSPDGKVMYIYRNDEYKLTSILISQINEMTLSKEDADNNICDEYVTHVIETQDSIYRIPMSVIDSVAFHPLPYKLLPETKVIDATMFEYIEQVDGDNILFRGDTPFECLPEEGAVLFTFGESGMLPDGFAGRVKKRERVNAKFLISCDPVGLDDVFERFFAYYGEDDKDYSLSQKVSPKTNYEPIAFNLNLLDYGAELNSEEEFSFADRDDVFFSGKVGIGINRFDGFVTPEKITFAPRISLWKPFFFIVEGNIDVEAKVELNIDANVGLGANFKLPKVEKIIDNTLKSLPKLEKLNEIFKKMPILPYGAISPILKVDGSLILGEYYLFRESFSNRFWVSLWGIRPIVIINLGKRDTDFLEARCKYAFGKVEAKIGLGFEVGLKSLNREEKDKDNKKKGWEVGLNFDVSLGCEVNVPIYLDSESINRRDLEIYKTFVEVPAFGFTGEVELSATGALNFQIPGFNVKQSEKYGLNLGGLLGMWNVPLFENGVFNKETKTVKFDISRLTVYPHNVGIAIYDEAEWEYSPMGNAKNPVIQYYQIPYSGDIIDFDCLGQEVIFPYDEFEMDLQTLRPLRKYTVYPIVDQKIFTNWCEAVPLLAGPPVEVYIDLVPFTKKPVLDIKNFTAELRGSVFPVDALDLIDYEVGFEFGKKETPVGQRSKLSAEMDEEGQFDVLVDNLESGIVYSYRAYVKIDGEYHYGEFRHFSMIPDDLVDLGLSVKWCNHNLGAVKAEDYGGYYAWWETEVKNEYNWATYFDSPYNDDGLWKGCDIDEDISATQYDAAFLGLGDEYRLPTKDEMQELVDNCSWEWSQIGDVYGFIVTGSNGNNIFLPAGGNMENDEVSNVGQYGGYWSSTPLSESSKGMAGNLYFFGSPSYTLFNTQWSNRYSGRSIRPVGK